MMRMPAVWHFATASATPARGGSSMAIKPAKHRSCSASRRCGGASSVVAAAREGEHAQPFCGKGIHGCLDAARLGWSSGNRVAVGSRMWVQRANTASGAPLVWTAGGPSAAWSMVDIIFSSGSKWNCQRRCASRCPVSVSAPRCARRGQQRDLGGVAGRACWVVEAGVVAAGCDAAQ